MIFSEAHVASIVDELVGERGAERNPEPLYYYPGPELGPRRVPICVVGHVLDRLGLLDLPELAAGGNIDLGCANGLLLCEHMAQEAVQALGRLQHHADRVDEPEDGPVQWKVAWDRSKDVRLPWRAPKEIDLARIEALERAQDAYAASGLHE